LIAVTDLRSEDPAILGNIEAAYRGGADIVQLRSKNLSDRSLYEIGLLVREIADRYRKLFFINDRLDLAMAVSADGVHLGHQDLPVACVRKLGAASKESLWIGKSTHSLEEARDAEEKGADYIAVGPVFATPTKSGVEPVGLPLIREVRDVIHRPFVAIGGIGLSNVDQVLKAGASRVAAVRAIFGADDVYEATQSLRNKIEVFCGNLV
jgi:thiamine-phosphate pyrophosphorylase